MRNLGGLIFGLVLLLASSSPVAAAVHHFVVPMDGPQEVNAQGVFSGDADGTGLATLDIDDSTSPNPTIAWNITLNNVDMPLTGAHIHQLNPGSFTGGIKIDFNSTLVGSGLQDADLTNLLANPAQFYVNVHNANFPSGAIRGNIVPEPSTLALGLFFGMAGFFAWARRNWTPRKK
jgi:hypothetical protein